MATLITCLTFVVGMAFGYFIGRAHVEVVTDEETEKQEIQAAPGEDADGAR